MYYLVCQTPAYFLSSQMAVLNSFLSVYHTWDIIITLGLWLDIVSFDSACQIREQHGRFPGVPLGGSGQVYRTCRSRTSLGDFMYTFFIFQLIYISIQVVQFTANRMATQIITQMINSYIIIGSVVISLYLKGASYFNILK